MLKLAEITSGLVTRIIVVDQGNIPEFCVDWPNAEHLRVNQVYDEAAADDLALEGQVAEVRSDRNALLQATDWSAGSDLTMSELMITYRQALRDLPQQEGFPTDITWPNAPE
tara:strand:+ start:1611 stop:1946 length:336 start_codon:yes stop_codon:yes gene_type:complete